MPRVSVVVISFNDAEHVVTAVRSALAQGREIGEVVVVDDASTDATPQALEAAFGDEPRVRVLRRTTNSGGCGTPRNDGLAAAAFPYLLFLDSDDVLPKGAAAALLAAADQHVADVTAGRAVRRELPGGRETLWAPEVYGPGAALPGTLIRGIAEHPEILKDTLSVNKLYRTAFLRDRSLLFPDGAFHYEDFVFTARVYAARPRIAYVDAPVYVWNVRRQAGEPVHLAAPGRHRQLAAADGRPPRHRRHLPGRLGDRPGARRAGEVPGLRPADVRPRAAAALPAVRRRLVAGHPRLRRRLRPRGPGAGRRALPLDRPRPHRARRRPPRAGRGGPRAARRAGRPAAAARTALRRHTAAGAGRAGAPRAAGRGGRPRADRRHHPAHAAAARPVRAARRAAPGGAAGRAGRAGGRGEPGHGGDAPGGRRRRLDGRGAGAHRPAGPHRPARGLARPRRDPLRGTEQRTPVEVRAADGQAAGRGVVVRRTGQVLLVQTHITGGRALVLRVADGMAGARRVLGARLRRLRASR